MRTFSIESQCCCADRGRSFGRANFAWMQYFIYHLSPNGQAGVVLAKGVLTAKTTGEGDIRKALIENGLIDCIVNVPAKLFKHPNPGCPVVDQPEPGEWEVQEPEPGSCLLMPAI